MVKDLHQLESRNNPSIKIWSYVDIFHLKVGYPWRYFNVYNECEWQLDQNEMTFQWVQFIKEWHFNGIHILIQWYFKWHFNGFNPSRNDISMDSIYQGMTFHKEMTFQWIQYSNLWIQLIPFDSIELIKICQNWPWNIPFCQNTQIEFAYFYTCHYLIFNPLISVDSFGLICRQRTFAFFTYGRCDAWVKDISASLERFNKVSLHCSDHSYCFRC